MKFGFKHYFKATPQRIRIIGDSLAAASLFVASLNLDNPKLMMIIGLAGGLGKFLTNFFSDENSKNQ
jgi:hypothetical protein